MAQGFQPGLFVHLDIQFQQPPDVGQFHIGHGLGIEWEASLGQRPVNRYCDRRTWREDASSGDG